MRALLGTVTGLVIWATASSAFAIDTVEQVIMKCRTNAVSTADQVTCLEEALRTRLPSEPAANWSGITEAGQMPSQQRSYTGPEVGQGAYLAGPTGMGSEQVKVEGAALAQRQAENRATEQSRVVDFAYNSKQRLIVILSNGQVWKQRDGDLRSVPLDDGDSPSVVVRKGAVSGYRMNFPDLNREITVSRIK